MTQRTAVYVDGFNLYYGALKGTAYKWLDIQQLFQTVLGSSHDIVLIRYFTAKVQSTTNNPDIHIRQDAYLKALQHQAPKVQIHYGHFLRHRIMMENASPPPDRIAVWKTEEKGSDVNLAVHLLNDAWKNTFDCAIVVSNDSDLAETLLLARRECKKTIGLITPGAPKRRTSKELGMHADFVRTIRESALRQSQLPQIIPGTGLHKPAGW